MTKILIIEDEKITRLSLSEILKNEGYEIFSAENGEDGLELFHTVSPDIVITDLRLPKIGGMEILKIVLEKDPGCRVILITAYASVDTAVESLKLGAFDYLTKPFSPEKLLSILRNINALQFALRENELLKSQLNELSNKKIIGNSVLMNKLKATIPLIAQNDSTILIEGESGTGKELIARALHESSLRKDASFITVSCSNIPESLLESELFGHEKGAFTGAIKRHTGYFERANGGTIFIDDIDDFPINMQIKLLRVIQERELSPVGSTSIIKIDVRIICATKINLKLKVDDNTFRSDLYYRLNIIPLKLPPLRERREDIPLLVDFFFRKHQSADKMMLLTPQIIDKLMNYHWPGNVRELQNIVERMIVLSYSGEIDPGILDFSKNELNKRNDNQDFYNFNSFDEYILNKESEVIRWALNKSNNNITNAAKILKIPRTTLNSKLEKLNLYEINKKNI